MNRTFIALWWLACITFTETLTAAPSSPARTPSALAGVSELARPVTLSETKIPLGELVQKVAEQTGARLSAAPEVADEPIAVVVKDFPARVLLEEIADFLDYRWSQRQQRERTGSPPAIRPNAQGLTPNAQRPNPYFEIWQDLAAKNREAALRRAAADEAFEEFRRALADRLRRAAGGQIASPIERTLLQMVGRLPAADWERLRRGGMMIFATDPEPSQRRLSAEIDQTFRSSRPNWAPSQAPSTSRSPEREAYFRKQEREAPELWAAASGYRVKIEMEGDPFTTQGFLMLSVEVTPVRNGEPKGMPSFHHGRDTRLFITGNALSAKIKREQRELLEETVQRRLQEEQYAPLATPREFKPEAKPYVDPFGPGDGTRWYLRDLLPDLARTYGVNFIADAYWRMPPAIDPAHLLKGPAPLAAHLQQIARTLHRWDRHGDLIRIRSERWAFDRPAEIPLRVTRRWKTFYEERGALPLEEYVTLALTLTEAQVETLFSTLPFVGVPRNQGDMDNFRHNRDALRLYATLPPTQRAALQQGRTLTVLPLPPAQQRLFLAALRGPGGTLEPEDLTQATLTLAERPMERIREEGVVPPHFRTAFVAARNTAPEPPGKDPPAPRRFPVTEIRLLLHRGADTTTYTLTVAR